MFKDDLSELDESREVIDNLVQEYEAATQPNYLSWQGTPPTCRSVGRFLTFLFLFVLQHKNQTLKNHESSEPNTHTLFIFINTLLSYD